ncbi:hypothetical protein BZA05DRAFT_249092 [Tricharina praecox]|uniref:uncharacterized protein n=1 Tax=Tricharina praecox TaxID=43433 RepID=UPI0022206C3F|nr:uncharacterized protein BZA05DRAFT_249092 [Tricharina praecox]KAI5854758.1 hypothetical protein BZA05DRAFT_249092 [Tricharina praecox]
MPAIISKRDGHHERAQEGSGPSSNTMRDLLITLVVLVAFCLVMCGTLFILRRIRRARKEAGTLPSYDSATRNRGNRLTIQTNRDSTFIFSEKQHLMDNSSPMPLSPDNVPEIRITFPEEEDKDGRRVSGRVVVVQVGEAGVGFVRPLDQSNLPPYQQSRPQERFDSVDIDRIGGLKEIR